MVGSGRGGGPATICSCALAIAHQPAEEMKKAQSSSVRVFLPRWRPETLRLGRRSPLTLETAEGHYCRRQSEHTEILSSAPASNPAFHARLEVISVLDAVCRARQPIQPTIDDHKQTRKGPGY